MKSNCLLIVIYLMTLLADIATVDGRIFCFRKLKKKNRCGGYLRHEKYSDTQSCCTGKGQGFADKKIKIGRNRFRCIPCSDTSTKGLPLSGDTDKSLTTAEPTTSTAASTTTTEFSWPVPARRNEALPADSLPEDHNGKFIVWEEWSPCSVSCGAGWRSRAKKCDGCDRNDYENVQSQPCMINFYCPVDGNWGPWYPWDSCTKSCDGGTRSRQRKCNYPPPAYGGENCPGDAVAVQECNRKPCPVDGNWSEWSEFSECSSTCGPGVSKRTRQCDSPLPQFGGKNCPGSELSTKKCEVVKCPVDGAWSLWGTWTLCTATCGRGIKERSRACDSPRPQFGGSECQGSATHQEECYGGQQCPVDGNWSPWSSYGLCRAPRCSRGFQIRSRTCTNPTPAHDGKPCVGQQYERAACYNDNDCPKNGSWCAWSEWNACSSSCREESSLQGRQRSCACPAPSNGGLECQGESFQIQECKNLPSCSNPENSEPSGNGAIDEESDPDANSNTSTEKSTTAQNSIATDHKGSRIEKPLPQKQDPTSKVQHKT